MFAIFLNRCRNNPEGRLLLKLKIIQQKPPTKWEAFFLKCINHKLKYYEQPTTKTNERMQCQINDLFKSYDVRLRLLIPKV